jgi:hypothetical protein
VIYSPVRRGFFIFKEKQWLPILSKTATAPTSSFRRRLIQKALR